MKPGVVLDIPAGGAIQSRALADLGYRVVSVDLFPAARREPTAAWICADANEALPFRDQSFDYVLSREGIEHLEDQMGFLRDCARVIRPGGKIVLTTPNLMHLSARASGFLTGQRNLRRGLIERDSDAAQPQSAPDLSRPRVHARLLSRAIHDAPGGLRASRGLHRPVESHLGGDVADRPDSVDGDEIFGGCIRPQRAPPRPSAAARRASCARSSATCCRRRYCTASEW